MRLVLGDALLAVAVGLSTGGKIGRIASLRITYPWAPWRSWAWRCSSSSRRGAPGPTCSCWRRSVLLAIFAVVNIKVPGFSLIFAGMLMNFLVIAVNHGMPVTQRALVDSGQSDTLTELVAHGGGEASPRRPGRPSPVPGRRDRRPASHRTRAVSAGDVVSYVGVA